MSNTVYFDLDDVYIDGLTINGNLTVKGVLYMTTSLNKIPDELETTPYKNIVLDYYQLDNLIASLKELDTILNLDKSNEWAISYLIKIYCKMQDWSNAFKYLEKYHLGCSKSVA